MFWACGVAACRQVSLGPSHGVSEEVSRPAARKRGGGGCRGGGGGCRGGGGGYQFKSVQFYSQPLSGHKNYRLQEGVQMIHKTTNIVRMCYKLCQAVQNYNTVRKQQNLRR